MAQNLIINLDRLSEADMLARAGAVLAAMTGNLHFPEPWPAPTPSLQRLTQVVTAHRDAYNAALSRDTAKIAQRDEARRTLTSELRRLAAYLDLAADDNLAKLATTGFEVRRPSTRTTASAPPAPTELRISDGPASGTLVLRLNRVPGAVAYEVQTSRGNTDDDNGWSHHLTSTLVQRIDLTGLPTGRLWVRLRGVNSAGAGYWSEPVSVVVG